MPPASCICKPQRLSFKNEKTNNGNKFREEGSRRVFLVIVCVS